MAGSDLMNKVDPGHVITSVDGVACSGTDVDTVASWIGMKPGETDVILTLLPGSRDNEQS